MSITSSPSTIDESRFSVRRSIRIAAPLEKVWSAITEPEHISRWFGKAVFDGAGVGSRGTLTFPDYGAVPVLIESFEPPRLISYRWSNVDALGSVPDALDPEHATVFTFTLQEVTGGTLLTVVETGFETTSDPAANLESHRAGWDSELDKLVALLEEGA